MSYKNLEIWERSRDLSITIHKMTLTELPKFEMFEVGSQIRRSSKSVRSNIVEGYGRRNYAKEYIRFLTFSIASNDETIGHLETLFETESLKNKILYDDLHDQLEVLGKKLNLFIQSIERNFKKNERRATSSQPPAPSHQPPATSSQPPATSSQPPATSNQLQKKYKLNKKIKKNGTKS